MNAVHSADVYGNQWLPEISVFSTLNYPEVMSAFSAQERLKASPTKSNDLDLPFHFFPFLSFTLSLYCYLTPTFVRLFIYISLSLHLWLC